LIFCEIKSILPRAVAPFGGIDASSSGAEPEELAGHPVQGHAGAGELVAEEVVDFC